MVVNLGRWRRIIANNMLACRKKRGRKKKRRDIALIPNLARSFRKYLISRWNWSILDESDNWNGATTGKQKQLMPMRFWHRLDIEIIDVSFRKKKNSIIEYYSSREIYNKRGEKLKKKNERDKERSGQVSIKFRCVKN